mmetsp:Transcript_21141/g.43155  ORF Transcript_21141/g.43155 Transcript_21141/m.43155 type:complete len:80 (-) Transcript_21141:2513-2752(-)
MPSLSVFKPRNRESLLLDPKKSPHNPEIHLLDYPSLIVEATLYWWMTSSFSESRFQIISHGFPEFGKVTWIQILARIIW